MSSPAGNEGIAMKTQKITTVHARWWIYGPQRRGWYAELRVGDRVVTDSQKIDFPVSVEDYDRDEADELAAALREEYPDAEIIVEG
jgi:hypothetical protein